eukprot:gb/GEZN01002250.1/.p1 GENE.gb/GEZN01002250.1/~~gb/GEZN01002250.1/.p1  ORF type:complete len:776 (+),score=81.20 gb/GEZN01002250.1/:101-2428(+)
MARPNNMKKDARRTIPNSPYLTINDTRNQLTRPFLPINNYSHNNYTSDHANFHSSPVKGPTPANGSPFKKRSVVNRQIQLHKPKRNYPVYGRRYWVLFVFSALACMRNVLCYSYAPVNSRAILYYQASEVQLSLFESCYFMSFVIVTMPTSIVIERKGLRTAVVWASWLQAIGAVMRFAAGWLYPELHPSHQYKLAISGQIVASFGQAVFANAPPLVAAVWFGKHERALATTIGVSAGFFGIAVAYIVSPLLVHGPMTDTDDLTTGMNVMLQTFAGLSVLFAIMASVYFPDRPPVPPSYTAELRLREWVRDKTIRLKQDFESAMTAVGHVQKVFTRESSAVPLEWSTWEINPRAFDRLRLLLPFNSKSNKDRIRDGETSIYAMLKIESKVLLSFFRQPGFVHCMLAFGLAEGLCNVYAVAMNGLLLPLGMNISFVSIMGIVYIISLVVGGVVAGLILERWGVGKMQRQMVCCCALLGVAQIWFSVLSTADAGNPYELATAITLVGFFTGPLQPIALECAAECTYPSSETAFTSVMQIAGNIFSAVLVPIVFWLRDRTNSHNRLSGGNFLEIILLFSLALFFMTFRGEMKRSARERIDFEASVATMNKNEQSAQHSHAEGALFDIGSLHRSKTFSWHPRLGRRRVADSDDEAESDVSGTSSQSNTYGGVGSYSSYHSEVRNDSDYHPRPAHPDQAGLNETLGLNHVLGGDSGAVLSGDGGAVLGGGSGIVQVASISQSDFHIPAPEPEQGGDREEQGGDTSCSSSSNCTSSGSNGP